MEVEVEVEEEEEVGLFEIGSSEVGSSGKASLSSSLSEKVVLVLLAVEGGAVKEGSGFLPSRRVLGRDITTCAIKECVIKACAIKACAIKACAIQTCAIKACAIKSCAVKAISGSCRQGRWVYRCLTGRSGLD